MAINLNSTKLEYGLHRVPVTDIVKTKSSMEKRSAGWKFVDYGPDNTSFENGRLAGGFSKYRRERREDRSL